MLTKSRAGGRAGQAEDGKVRGLFVKGKPFPGELWVLEGELGLAGRKQRLLMPH